MIDGKIDVDSYAEDKIRRPEYAVVRRNGVVYERSVDTHFAHGTRHDPLTLDEQEAAPMGMVS